MLGVISHRRSPRFSSNRRSEVRLMKAPTRNSTGTFAILLFALAVVAAASAPAARAQTGSRDMRIVSARAGGVNYVFGDVKYQRAGRGAWRTLDTKVNLETGDVVRTGTAGLAEVLLNPGSYLRLGTNSEVELADASLEDLRVRLSRGSVVVEATGYDKRGVSIKVETAQTLVSVIRTGIYRVNALDGAATEVAVHKGRALVGRSVLTALTVKGGQVSRVPGAPEVAKLDKKDRDALDQWSKERGEELAELNRRMTRRQTNALIASLNHFSAAYPFGSGGVWYYDGRRNCYSFMPFTGGWQSPYGGWYGNVLWGYSASCGSCPGGRGPMVFRPGSMYGTPGDVWQGGPTPTSGGTSPGPAVYSRPTPSESLRPADGGGGLRQKMSPRVEQ
jgi:hypothetical protein